MNRRTILLFGIAGQILVLLFSFLFFTRHINKNDEVAINYYYTLPVIQEKNASGNSRTVKHATRKPYHTIQKISLNQFLSYCAFPVPLK